MLELDRKLFNQFLQESHSVQSLLFFDDEFDQIESLFKIWLGKNVTNNVNSSPAPSKSNRIIFGNEPVFYNDLLDLKMQMDDLLSDDEIKKMNSQNIKITKKENSSSNKGQSSNGRPKGQSLKKTKEEIGFLGEYIF